MPRKKRRGEVKSLIIELDMNDPRHKVIYDHWQQLSEMGQAAEWARKALSVAMGVPSELLIPTRASSHMAMRPAVPKTERPFTPVPKPGKGK